MSGSFKKFLSNLLLSLVSLVIGLVLIEACFRIYVITRQPSQGIKYTPDDIWTEYDPVTGWKNSPGAVVKDVIIDQYGFRIGDESNITRPAGKRVIFAGGDSFTFGYGVTGREAWPTRLEKMFPNQQYDVLNLGVCAYGIDQMYLHYGQTARRYQPEIVLVAFMSWDIERVVRKFWMNGREKPRYLLRDGELTLTNVPVPLKLDSDMKRMSWNDILFNRKKIYLLARLQILKKKEDSSENPVEIYLAEKITPDKYAEGALLSQKILEQWRDKVESGGGRFVVVIIPTEDEISTYRSHIKQLMANLIESGVEVLDCQPALREKQAGAEIFLGNKHPSAFAQDIIASEVYYYLLHSQSGKNNKNL